MCLALMRGWRSSRKKRKYHRCDHDNIGIIAHVRELLCRFGVNTQDISQTVMGSHFTVVILVNVKDYRIPMEA